MSPASYLTAPPRVAGRIVAPCGADSIAAMWGWIVLAAAVVGLAAVGVSGWLLGTRALRAWRAPPGFPRTTPHQARRPGHAPPAAGQGRGEPPGGARPARGV